MTKNKQEKPSVQPAEINPKPIKKPWQIKPLTEAARITNRKAVLSWKRRNPGKVKEYEKKRKPRVPYKNRPILQKIAQASRVRIGQMIRRNKIQKTQRSESYIGCDWSCLKQHIEAMFLPGMNWDNYGFKGWHIDHIKPLSGANTIEELTPLLHFSNLQPLWAFDNLSKGNKALRA